MGELTSYPAVTKVPLEATHLRQNLWCVRPVGQLGTCGFHPVPWTAQFIWAKSAEAALRAAKPVLIATCD